MTNKEIEKFKQNLQDLFDKQEIPNIVKQLESLMALAKSIGAPIPPTSLPLNPPINAPRTYYNEDYNGFINEIVRNIHTTLQTEEMFNACVTSKRACWWAFAAAFVACISVILQNWPWFLSILFLLRGKLKL